MTPRPPPGPPPQPSGDPPEWFVRLYTSQWQDKGGKPYNKSHRRGSGQDNMELRKYWRVVDESRRLQEALDARTTRTMLGSLKVMAH